jgi:hypothetical protein
VLRTKNWRDNSYWRTIRENRIHRIAEGAKMKYRIADGSLEFEIWQCNTKL